MPDVDDDQIGHLAHALWEQAGRPQGLDQHFWFAARSKLLSEAAPSSAGAAGMQALDGAVA